MGVDLSLKDIRFLRAIRDINNDPESYPETDRGEVPANKASIREVTGLSSKAIEYRLASNSHNRGFGQDDLGLIKIHSATIEGNTFGPKSAELTSKGLEELSNVEDDGILGENTESESEAIKQLRARLEEIENTEFSGESDVTAGELASMVEQVRTRIDELESQIDKKYETLEQRIEGVESGEGQTDWGNVSEEKAEDLDRVLRMAPAIAFAWSEVLGISLQEIINSDDVSEEMIKGYRETAAQSLQSVLVDGFEGMDSESGDGSDAEFNTNAQTEDADVETPSEPMVDEANTDGGGVKTPNPEEISEQDGEQVTLDDDADIIEDGGEVVEDGVSKSDSVDSE